jgi:Fe-S oxidoreductase
MTSVSLERGITDFKAQIDAPVASFFSSCVHCGLCAEACLFYLETGDPTYTPIRKLEPMRRIWEQEYTLVGKLKKLLGLSKAVTDAELAEWEELLYDSCTMCGRCSQVCPVGNDIAYMVRKAREGMVSSGHAPEGLVGASTRAVTIGSPMGVKLPAVLNQIKHVEADTGLKIPVDVEGAEYMALLSSTGILRPVSASTCLIWFSTAGSFTPIGLPIVTARVLAPTSPSGAWPDETMPSRALRTM